MSWEEEEEFLQNARKNRELRELVEGGLRFICFGACSFTITIIVGGFLYAYQNGVLALPACDAFRDDHMIFALTAVALIAGAGFLATCLGLWRCLVHTPSFKNAKETIFLCVILFLTGVVCEVVALFVGGPGAFAELYLQVATWRFTHHLPPAAVLQVAGVGLFLLSFFAFSHYLLILHEGLRKTQRRRVFDLYLIFTSLLVGSFIGAYLSMDRLMQQRDVLLLFVAGSLVNFFWFLYRVQTVRSLLVDQAAPDEVACTGITLENTPQRLSGMRRILKAMNKGP